jgi:hypothetical protein
MARTYGKIHENRISKLLYETRGVRRKDGKTNFHHRNPEDSLIHDNDDEDDK